MLFMLGVPFVGAFDLGEGVITVIGVAIIGTSAKHSCRLRKWESASYDITEMEQKLC